MDSNLKALIFDVDGTLADNERDGHRVAFNLAFSDAGLNWVWDPVTYDHLLQIYGGKERIRHFIEQHQPDFDQPADLDAFIRDLHRQKTRHYVGLLKSGAIPLRPGVERLLREARSVGLRLAIASTTTPENVTTLLTATLGGDSIAWFDVIASGDIVARKKPAPDIYEYVLQELGLAAAQCLAIEDSQSGLAAARAAGLVTVVTANRATRNQDFSGAAIALDQLGEPGQEFEVLAGDAGDATWVDVALLRRIFKTCQGARAGAPGNPRTSA
jgi:HAD superfamily hydrolase (TIGR01509 family)